MAKKKYKNSQRLEFRRLHFKIVKARISRLRKKIQKFSKLNFTITAWKLYFKIFKITNFTSHRNQNDPKVTNITPHEDEKNIKILKDQNFEDCISKLSKSRISRGPEKFSSQNFEDYISKFSESRISHLTMARKIQKFSKILKISRLPQL